MKRKNTIISLGLVLSFLICPLNSFARDTNYTEGKSFVWSPKSFPTSIGNSSSYLYSYTNLQWDQAGVNYVNDLLSNFYDYYTMEMNNVDDQSISALSGYTDLPDGTWDSESDSDSPTGNAEEMEYYWANTDLTANTYYKYNIAWGKADEFGSGDLHLIAQMGPLHQGYDYDLLDITHYSYSPIALLSNVEQLTNSFDSGSQTAIVAEPSKEKQLNDHSKVRIISSENKLKAQVVIKDFNSIDDLNDYRKVQKNSLQEILNRNEKEKIDVMVTFKKPLTLEMVNELGIKQGKGVFNFTGTNKDGERITGFFLNNVEGREMYSKYSDEITIDGIISYSGTIDTKNAVQFASDDLVALVDISESIIKEKLQKEYPKHQIVIKVPHIYYEYQALNK